MFALDLHSERTLANLTEQVSVTTRLTLIVLCFVYRVSLALTFSGDHPTYNSDLGLGGRHTG